MVPFRDWVDQRGRGTLTRLMRETGLAYSTVYDVYLGYPVGRRAAEALAKATEGECAPESMILGSRERPPRARRKKGDAGEVTQ